ncbi:hypothetical protein B0T16DRAFT_393724 [Cercophora newfieldiana]|uniref:Uncharacterized protein n=1 Tax=Cercophora newfieldiana TaxID=92897 RepID=A0AA40CK75_9PEZI|nr:hypothetical protein B0T16DRAFT_393724 [Cercophora newfieldiana]
MPDSRGKILGKRPLQRSIRSAASGDSSIRAPIALCMVLDQCGSAEALRRAGPYLGSLLSRHVEISTGKRRWKMGDRTDGGYVIGLRWFWASRCDRRAVRAEAGGMLERILHPDAIPSPSNEDKVQFTTTPPLLPWLDDMHPSARNELQMRD